jgi:putative DNA primase/helicase
MQFAFKVPNLIALEAAGANDEANKKALLKHAISTQSARALEAIVRLAKHRREIAANVEDFDPHNHLLNVANGTIDLRTGKIRKYCKEDKITKLVPVEYDTNASAPLFDKFLTRIFDGNQSLIGFMQRVCGYTLTGESGEQCLFLLHGDGANGKSTFLEVIAALTAEYGMHVRTEALMKHKNTSAGGASEDIAELRGSRFVSAVETNVGQQLAEGLLKQVTGQDRVKARKLYGHNIEFRPTFKLWLACNHKPEIAGTDHAIWRRIHLIPFEVTIPENEREKRILDKLKAELPGILAWCVRGAAEYYMDGLKIPDEVKRATQRYQSEQDTLSEFVADTCEVDANLTTPVSEIYLTFEMWCRANGEAVMHRKLFAQMMRARGFKQAQAHRGRIWRGIAPRRFTVSPHVAEGGATPQTARIHNSPIGNSL